MSSRTMKRFVLVVSAVGFAGLGCDGGPYVAYCGNRPCMDGGSNPFDGSQLDINAVETRDPALIVSSMTLSSPESGAADVAADPVLNASFEIYGYAPAAIAR